MARIYNAAKTSNSYSVSEDDNSLQLLLERYKRFLISLVGICLLLLVISVVFIVLLSLELSDKPPFHPSPDHAVIWPPPSESVLARFPRAMVASDNGLCAEIGRNILIEGGNAVDAIIATNICQGALNSESSGLGGGFFLTVYNRTTKTCTVIDARETAPGLANDTMFVNTTGLSLNGYLAIAVPGELHGMWTAHERFGRLPWRNLFQPTIQLCRTGFPVSGILGEILRTEQAAGNVLTSETGLDVFINPATKKAYQVGDIMTRPLLANTLEQLALSENPINLFYNGSIGKAIVSEIQKGGGIITEEDLRNYNSIVHTSPVVLKIANTPVTMCGPPPPSSSVLIASILNVLGGYIISPVSVADPDSEALIYHRLLETFKFAFAARSNLGDLPDIEKLVKNLTSLEWAESVRTHITNKAHPSSYYGGDYEVPEDHGTTHMESVDPDGSAASLTATINMYFGCKQRSKLTGIIFNDEMDDFSTPGLVNSFGLEPSPENFIEPGKRPQSSMSPVIFTHDKTGDVELLLGASGGSRIITAVSYVATRILLLNETVKRAIDAPRLHNQLFPNTTEKEDGFPEKLLKILFTDHAQLFDTYEPREMSVVIGIRREHDKTLAGNSDYRKKGGYPAGF